MKIIERPESTTYYDEIPYQYIKDEKEFYNVMGVGSKDIIIMRRSVHPDTFMPMVWFAVPNILKINKDDIFMNNHMFYVSILEKIAIV